MPVSSTPSGGGSEVIVVQDRHLPALVAELHPVIEDLTPSYGADLGVRTVVGAQLELVREVGVHGERDAHGRGRRAVAGDAQRLHERAVGDGLLTEERVRGRFVAPAARDEYTACRVAVRDRRSTSGTAPSTVSCQRLQVPGVRTNNPSGELPLRTPLMSPPSPTAANVPPCTSR